ncbi:unnamed protein product [Caenorhabditis auriculariae]|uniref:Uncharacterized protein n=1 Tax=Caenorhabditis auriculariae TaxID=2777116 RepID=A0A8S1HHL2_9PELO|nr:unnamed protein product [Caenorhabditis auriculariae]
MPNLGHNGTVGSGHGRKGLTHSANTLPVHLGTSTTAGIVPRVGLFIDKIKPRIDTSAPQKKLASPGLPLGTTLYRFKTFN